MRFPFCKLTVFSSVLHQRGGGVILLRLTRRFVAGVCSFPANGPRAAGGVRGQGKLNWCISECFTRRLLRFVCQCCGWFLHVSFLFCSVIRLSCKTKVFFSFVLFFSPFLTTVDSFFVIYWPSSLGGRVRAYFLCPLLTTSKLGIWFGPISFVLYWPPSTWG